MKQKPQNKEFLDLQREWYDKLKKEGFKDIENSTEDLIVYHSTEFIKKGWGNPILYDAKAEYYRSTGKFLHDHNFKDETERTIWDLHNQGLSVRTIVTKLKRKNINLTRWKVHDIIKDLFNEMVKSWNHND